MAQAPAPHIKHGKVLINVEPIGLVDRLEHYYKVQNLEVELVPCVVDVNSHRPLQKLWAYYLLNLKKYGCCKEKYSVVRHICPWTLHCDVSGPIP